MVSSSDASIGWLSPLKNTCCKLALAEDEKNSRGESGRAFWPGEDGKYKALKFQSSIFTPLMLFIPLLFCMHSPSCFITMALKMSVLCLVVFV